MDLLTKKINKIRSMIDRSYEIETVKMFYKVRFVPLEKLHRYYCSNCLFLVGDVNDGGGVKIAGELSLQAKEKLYRHSSNCNIFFRLDGVTPGEVSLLKDKLLLRLVSRSEETKEKEVTWEYCRI